MAGHKHTSNTHRCGGKTCPVLRAVDAPASRRDSHVHLTPPFTVDVSKRQRNTCARDERQARTTWLGATQKGGQTAAQVYRGSVVL